MSYTDKKIFVPFRQDDIVDRMEIFNICKKYYEDEGFLVEECDSGHEPFNVSASRNLCKIGNDDDLIIIVDADTIIPSYAIDEAVDLAKKYNVLVKPTIRTYLLNDLDSLKEVILKIKSDEIIDHLVYKSKSPDLHPGSSWVIPKNIFKEVGGFNEDFFGYGFEDLDFNYKCAMISKSIYFTEYSAFSVHHPIKRYYGDEKNSNLFELTKSFWGNKLPDIGIYSNKRFWGSPDDYVKKVFRIE